MGALPQQPRRGPSTRKDPSREGGDSIASGRCQHPHPTNHGPMAVNARMLAGAAVIVGTLPYLTLKLLWLTGSTVGLTDPAFADDTSLHYLNLATAGMDLVAVLVALALTQNWGLRLPAWLVLLPIWIGTGFLAPILLAAPLIVGETD